MSMKKAFAFLLVLAAVLTGCKDKIALFPPIVEGSTLTASAQPTFKWKEAVGGATYYMVSVIDQATGKEAVAPVKVSAVENVSWQVPKKLPDGVYVLQVVSYRPGEKKKDPDVASPAVTFLFTVNTGSINAAPTVECIEGSLISERSPSFRWTEAADAASYAVSLKKKGDDESWNAVFDTLTFSADVRYLKLDIELEDGCYILEVLPYTVLGKAAEESGSVEFEVNTEYGTTPPEILSPKPAEEGGVYETNKKTIEIEWRAESFDSGEQAPCRFQMKAVETTEGVVPDTDKWVSGALSSAVFNKLTEGLYVFFVQAQNELGIWSKEAALFFRVDITAPDVPEFIADPALVSTDTTVGFQCIYVSDDTVKIIAKEEGGANLGVGTVDVPEQVEEDWRPFTKPFSQDTGLEAGTYRFYFSAVDAAGNESRQVEVSVVYQPIDADKPSFTRWEGAISETSPGSGYWYTDQVELVWMWASVPGLEAGAEYKTAYFFTPKNDGQNAVPQAPEVSTEGGWIINKGTSYSVTAEEEGYYTLYLSQLIDGNDAGNPQWSVPVGLTYIVDRTSKPQPPINLIGSTKVGSVETISGEKLGYPTWSWDIANPENIAYFEYQINVKNGNQATSWMQTDSVNERSVTVTSGLPESLANRPYVFSVRSVNIVGIASDEVTFETEVVDSASLPPAPIVTAVADRVGGEGSQAVWNWTYPDGKTVSKVWASVGREPNTAEEPLPTGTTTYSVSYGDEYKGKDTSLMLFVVACYTDDEGTNSLPAAVPIIMDGLAPDAPVIGGSEETTEFSPTWTLSHPNPRDVAAYRWQFTVDEETAGSGWKQNEENPTANTVVYDETATVGETVTVHVQASDEFGNWSGIATFRTYIKEAPPAPTVAVPDYEATAGKEGGPWLNFSMKNAEVKVTQNGDTNVSQIDSVRYRFSNGGSAWTVVPQSSPVTEVSFNIADGLLIDAEDVTLFVQVRVGGDWSISAEYPIALIDINPPTAPAPMLQGKVNTTGDTTPRIEWAAVSGASKYVCVFRGETTETQNAYFTCSELSDGAYSMTVKAVDAAQNESPSVEYRFTVDRGAVDYSLPEVITVKMDNYLVKGWTKVQWAPESKSEKYAVYKLSADEVSGAVDLTQKTPVVDFTDMTVASAEKGYGYDETKGLFYAYVESGDEGAYYAVVGMEEEGKTGKFLTSYNQAAKNTAYGIALAPVSNFRTQVKTDSINLSWNAQGSGYTYRILRAGPYSAEKTPALTEFKVLANGNAWTDVSDESSVLNGAVLSANSYSDTSVDAAITDSSTDKRYIYRVYMVNENTKNSKAAFTAQFSGLTGLFEMGSPAERTVRIFIPDPSTAVTLTASQGDAAAAADQKTQGKIKLTLKPSEELLNLIDLFDVQIERTYRYNGTHQGYKTNELASDAFGTLDLSNHTNLSDPSPAKVAWEKSIILEYPVNFTSTNELTVYDTLYDTDDSTGEKLIAVRRKWSENNMHPWYERTQSKVNQNASKYDVVYDPDGTPSEYEWHYLNWDWVMRKYMWHPDNPLAKTYPSTGNANSRRDIGDRPGRFDFKEAVRCDYRVVLTYKSDTAIQRKTANPVYGYPSLTPREFASLGMILREIAFYEIPAAYYDEVEEQGTGLDRDPRTEKGWNNNRGGNNDGSIELVNVSVDIFALAGTAHLRTNGNGYSYFRDLFIKFDWTGFTIKLGGSAAQCLNNNKIDIITPIEGMKGSVSMTAYLYGGTYFHGMQSGSSVSVTYPGASNFRLELGANYGTGNYRALPSNEYLQEGWGRVDYFDSASGYGDRYTSINWEFKGRVFPGKWYSTNKEI